MAPRRRIKSSVDKAVISREWLQFTIAIANRLGPIARAFGRHLTDGDAVLAVFIGDETAKNGIQIDAILDCLPSTAEIGEGSFPLRVVAGKDILHPRGNMPLSEFIPQ